MKKLMRLALFMLPISPLSTYALTKRVWKIKNIIDCIKPRTMIFSKSDWLDRDLGLTRY